MPTHAERLRQVVLKVARAKEHRAELERLMGSFLSKSPYKVAVRRQEGTHKPVYFVESAEGMPDAIPLVAGDVIQNLMSALDNWIILSNYRKIEQLWPQHQLGA